MSGTTPVEVKSLGKYRLWLRYSDGVSGEVDLRHLAHRGIFQRWEAEGFFDRVSIGDIGQVRWDDDLELCPDSLYHQLTGTLPPEFRTQDTEAA